MSTRKNRDCPKGYIWRRGYTRKFRQSIKSSGFTVRRRGKLITVHPKSNAIYVAPGCIKDRGLRRQETEKNNTVCETAPLAHHSSLLLLLSFLFSV
jgi:hypothetical protein